MAGWGPPELYRQPIGGGHAGFVVSNGRAITMEQRKDKEAVVAYDLHTGSELWSHSTPRASESMGEMAHATPTLHEGTVYSLGAAGDLVALSMEDGTRRWHHNVLEELEADNLRGRQGRLWCWTARWLSRAVASTLRDSSPTTPRA